MQDLEGTPLRHCDAGGRGLDIGAGRLAAALGVVIAIWASPSHAGPAMTEAREEGESRDLRVAETMLVEDPEVKDQIVVPIFTYQNLAATSDQAGTRELDFGFEIEKRLTERISVSIDDGYSLLTARGVPTRDGFQDITLNGKIEIIRDPQHELLISAGLQRSIGRSGARRVEESRTGATTPILYIDRGLGDVAWAPIRPLQFNALVGFAVADQSLKTVPTINDVRTAFDGGLENRWLAGFAFRYSLAYLDGAVVPTGAPDWALAVTPIVEVAWSAPASAPSRDGTKWQVAPGFVWANETVQFGLELLIPANRATGRNVGVFAEFRTLLGPLVAGLGRPLFE